MSLAGAGAMQFCTWNSWVQDVRRVFDGQLHEEQLEAVTTLAYVYLWFGKAVRAGPTESEHDLQALWTDLQGLLLDGVVMAACLGTAGEDIVMNVEQWARLHIGVSRAVYKYKCGRPDADVHIPHRTRFPGLLHTRVRTQSKPPRMTLWGICRTTRICRRFFPPTNLASMNTFRYFLGRISTYLGCRMQ